MSKLTEKNKSNRSKKIYNRNSEHDIIFNHKKRKNNSLTNKHINKKQINIFSYNTNNNALKNIYSYINKINE